MPARDPSREYERLRDQLALGRPHVVTHLPDIFAEAEHYRRVHGDPGPQWVTDTDLEGRQPQPNEIHFEMMPSNARALAVLTLLEMVLPALYHSDWWAEHADELAPFAYNPDAAFVAIHNDPHQMATRRQIVQLVLDLLRAQATDTISVVEPERAVVEFRAQAAAAAARLLQGMRGLSLSAGPRVQIALEYAARWAQHNTPGLRGQWYSDMPALRVFDHRAKRETHEALERAWIGRFLDRYPVKSAPLYGGDRGYNQLAWRTVGAKRRAPADYGALRERLALPTPRVLTHLPDIFAEAEHYRRMYPPLGPRWVTDSDLENSDARAVSPHAFDVHFEVMPAHARALAVLTLLEMVLPALYHSDWWAEYADQRVPALTVWVRADALESTLAAIEGRPRRPRGGRSPAMPTRRQLVDFVLRELRLQAEIVESSPTYTFETYQGVPPLLDAAARAFWPLLPSNRSAFEAFATVREAAGWAIRNTPFGYPRWFRDEAALRVFDPNMSEAADLALENAWVGRFLQRFPVRSHQLLWREEHNAGVEMEWRTTGARRRRPDAPIFSVRGAQAFMRYVLPPYRAEAARMALTMGLRRIIDLLAPVRGGLPMVFLPHLRGELQQLLADVQQRPNDPASWNWPLQDDPWTWHEPHSGESVPLRFLDDVIVGLRAAAVEEPTGERLVESGAEVASAIIQFGSLTPEWTGQRYDDLIDGFYEEWQAAVQQRFPFRHEEQEPPAPSIGISDVVVGRSVTTGTAESHLGYRAVGWDGQRAYSLYDQRVTYDLTVGSEVTASGKGLFLASHPQYVLDYYSGLTDDDELLLTYAYDPRDLLAGDPGEVGELRVRRATLVKVEPIVDSVRGSGGAPVVSGGWVPFEQAPDCPLLSEIPVPTLDEHLQNDLALTELLEQLGAAELLVAFDAALCLLEQQLREMIASGPPADEADDWYENRQPELLSEAEAVIRLRNRFLKPSKERYARQIRTLPRYPFLRRLEAEMLELRLLGGAMPTEAADLMSNHPADVLREIFPRLAELYRERHGTAGPVMRCQTCGHPMTIDEDSGVSHHLDLENEPEVDYETDADHVAVWDQEDDPEDPALRHQWRAVAWLLAELQRRLPFDRRGDVVVGTRDYDELSRHLRSQPTRHLLPPAHLPEGRPRAAHHETVQRLYQYQLGLGYAPLDAAPRALMMLLAGQQQRLLVWAANLGLDMVRTQLSPDQQRFVTGIRRVEWIRQHRDLILDTFTEPRIHPEELEAWASICATANAARESLEARRVRAEAAGRLLSPTETFLQLTNELVVASLCATTDRWYVDRQLVYDVAALLVRVGPQASAASLRWMGDWLNYVATSLAVYIPPIDSRAAADATVAQVFDDALTVPDRPRVPGDPAWFVGAQRLHHLIQDIEVDTIELVQRDSYRTKVWKVPSATIYLAAEPMSALVAELREALALLDRHDFTAAITRVLSARIQQAAINVATDDQAAALDRMRHEALEPPVDPGRPWRLVLLEEPEE